MKKMRILTLVVLDGKMYCIPKDFADGGKLSYQKLILALVIEQ